MGVTGVVPLLSLVGLGVMAPVHGGGGRTGTTAAESALRAQRFTTRVAARSGEWKTMRRSPVAWAALGGAVCAAPLSGGRKAAAGVGHGAAHLLQLVADARKRPGVRAVQGQGGGDGEQGANAVTGEIEEMF